MTELRWCVILILFVPIRSPDLQLHIYGSSVTRIVTSAGVFPSSCGGRETRAVMSAVIARIAELAVADIHSCVFPTRAALWKKKKAVGTIGSAVIAAVL